MSTAASLYARQGKSYAATPQQLAMLRGQASDRALIGNGLRPNNPTGIGVANDAFTNAAARMGYGTNSVAEGAEYELIRWTYNYWLMITLYRNQWIPRNIVDIPAQDMVRAWPRLTSEIDPKDITSINRVIRRTGTKEQLLDTLKWSRLFGGAGAVMQIDGHENRLDEPLDLDTIELGAYRGLLPFDRWVGIYPDGPVCNDITKPLEFNLPEFYRVQVPGGGTGFQIHASRVLRFCGPSVPAPEYQAQMYWGISVLEIAYEAMKMRDNMLWNMLGLTFRANLLSYQFDELAQALSGASMSQQALVMFYNRLAAMNDVLSNQNMLVLPKDSQLQAQSYAFSGCSEMMEQFRYEVAGASGIPEMRLFGHSPTGMGVKDDPAERLYEEKIAMDQEVSLRPQLDKLYPVMCMSVLGEVPEDLDLVFPSIRIPTEDERASLSKTIADGVVVVFNAGLIDNETALLELKQSSDTTGLWTNITPDLISAAREKDKAAKEIQKAQQEAMLLGPAPAGGEGQGEGETELKAPEPETPKVHPSRAADSLDALRSMTFAGLPLTIEFEQGERRVIMNADREIIYSRKMQFPYGEIDGTTGRDGDPVDVIIGPAENAPTVFVCDMEDLGPDEDQRQDEDKVCLGFQSRSAAVRAFESMYPPEWLVNIEEVPLAEFIERLLDDGATLQPKKVATDGARAFKEEEHPRGDPDNPGQFVTKGTGSAGKGGSVSQAAIKPYDVKKFRKPRAGEKVPGSWKPDSVLINPDPNADVKMVGTMKQSGRKIVTYSKEYIARNLAERGKKWPAWALKLKIPPAATGVRLYGPKEDLQARYISTTGVEYSVYSESFKAQQQKQKFKRVKALTGKIDKIRERIAKDANSRNVDVAHPAQAAAIAAFYGARPGGSEGRETPKDWDNDLYRKAKKTSGITDLAGGIQAAVADPKNVAARAWVKSNFYQTDIDSAVDKLVRAKKIDAEDAEDFFTRLHWSTQQWPRWATELDTKELPEFGSSGIVTLRGEHVQQENGKTFLRFIGKESKPNEFEISDPEIAGWLLKAKKTAETDKDAAGFLFPQVDAADVLKYSKKVGAEKTKDFRTQIGSSIAREVIGDIPAPKTAKELKKAKLKVGARVARKLCNTPTMAVSAYIDPAIFKPWEDAIEE